MSDDNSPETPLIDFAAISQAAHDILDQIEDKIAKLAKFAEDGWDSMEIRTRADLTALLGNLRALHGPAPSKEPIADVGQAQIEDQTAGQADESQAAGAQIDQGEDLTIAAVDDEKAKADAQAEEDAAAVEAQRQSDSAAIKAAHAGAEAAALQEVISQGVAGVPATDGQADDPNVYRGGEAPAADEPAPADDAGQGVGDQAAADDVDGAAVPVDEIPGDRIVQRATPIGDFAQEPTPAAPEAPVDDQPAAPEPQPEPAQEPAPEPQPEG